MGITTSDKLSEVLLAETGVATIPGASFGRRAGELTLRMAYVDFDGGEAMQAADREPNDRELNALFLRKYCPRVTDAMERICTWVSSVEKQKRSASA